MTTIEISLLDENESRFKELKQRLAASTNEEVMLAALYHAWLTLFPDYSTVIHADYPAGTITTGEKVKVDPKKKRIELPTGIHIAGRHIKLLPGIRKMAVPPFSLDESKGEGFYVTKNFKKWNVHTDWLKTGDDPIRPFKHNKGKLTTLSFLASSKKT
jgi:hypothetical protein